MGVMIANVLAPVIVTNQSEIPLMVSCHHLITVEL